jgi:hypothetical protein
VSPSPQQSLQPKQETLVEEARTSPKISYLLYYLTLIVYSSYFAVGLLEGPEAAEELASRLVNDHAAVADGDTLRLFTSAFLLYTPTQLITTLLALFSVAAELESIVGPPTFWAIYSLSTIIGALADAAFSPWPVTHGPSAALAGTVGALLAHLIHNVEDLEGAPEKIMSRFKPWEQFLPRAEEELQQEPLSSQDDQDLKPKKVGIAEGLELTLLLPKEGRLWVDAVGLTAAAFTILDQIYSSSRDDASWQGMAVGFVVGACLGWGLGPVYDLVEVSAGAGESVTGHATAAAATAGAGSQVQPDSNSSSSNSSSSGSTMGETAAGGQQQQQQGAPQAPRQLRLVDKKTALERFNIALGLSSVVFGATAAWILTTGP